MLKKSSKPFATTARLRLSWSQAVDPTNLGKLSVHMFEFVLAYVDVRLACGRAITLPSMIDTDVLSR